MNPEVSILMAVHKPDLRYFKKQLQSISEQTFENFECIVSDDSHDPEVAKQIQSALDFDSRFVYRSCETQGVVKNFENAYLGASQSSEYCAFSDQDDWWHSDKIATQVKRLKKHKDLLLVHSDARVVDANGKLLHASLWKLEGRNTKNHKPIDIFLKNNVTGCLMLGRRSVFDLALPFPSRYPETGLLHDHWVALVASLIRPDGIRPISKPLLDYRQHNNNVVGASNDKLSNSITKTYKTGLQSYRLSLNLLAEIVSEKKKANPELSNDIELKFSRCLKYAARGDFTRATKLALVQL